MKFIAVLVAIVAAFFIGRNTAPEFVGPPSIPIASVQATQPIAVTTEVILTPNKGSTEVKPNIHLLTGTVHYRLTNLTDEPVKLAFPPVRIIGISGNSIGHDSLECPEALAKQESVVIPPHGYITRSGPWGSTVLGDLDEALQGGAGRHAYTFSSPVNEQSDVSYFRGTLIAFQGFRDVPQPSIWHTFEGHLDLVKMALGSPDADKD